MKVKVIKEIQRDRVLKVRDMQVGDFAVLKHNKILIHEIQTTNDKCYIQFLHDSYNYLIQSVEAYSSLEIEEILPAGTKIEIEI